VLLLTRNFHGQALKSKTTGSDATTLCQAKELIAKAIKLLEAGNGGFTRWGAILKEMAECDRINQLYHKLRHRVLGAQRTSGQFIAP